MNEEKSRQPSQEFLARLGHEMRTHLNNILGSAELLQSQLIGHEENLEQILKSGRHLLELTEGLTNTAAKETAGHLGPVQQPSAAPAQRLLTVLYVEDNQANYTLVDRILKQRPGIKLISATHGEAAIDTARKQAPDLILLDLNLPDIHGSEVLQRLQQDAATQSIPVVVISADATSAQIERLLTMGARNYITKPFRMDRFLFTVDEVLQESSRRARTAGTPAQC